MTNKIIQNLNRLGEHLFSFVIMVELVHEKAVLAVDRVVGK